MSLPLSARCFEDKQASIPAKSPINAEFEAALKEGSSFTRTTIGKRVLTYILKVLQQPKEGRICDSGVKNSAGRSPADLGPVIISLLIFELKLGVQTNITFSYDASFFTFAALEVAPAHHHSLQKSQGHILPPVLIGCPVSGACYLDHFRQEIFFMFPDLSIRHEGKYRLCFNLYEAIKHLDDHDDSGADLGSFAEAAFLTEKKTLGEEFHWRLELKSTAFTVFSAKKIPGLAESTSLSRIVTEQGCRVRIRRDVRLYQRKRRPSIKEKNFPPWQNSTPLSPSSPVIHDDDLLSNSIISSAKEKMEPFNLGRETSRYTGSKLPELPHTNRFYNLGPAPAPSQISAMGGWGPQEGFTLPRLQGSTDKSDSTTKSKPAYPRNTNPTVPQAPTAQRWSSEISPEERLRLDLPRYTTEEEWRRAYEQVIPNKEIKQAPDGPQNFSNVSNAGAPLNPTSQLGPDGSVGEMQSHTPEDAETKASPAVSKEAIWSALIRCFPFEAGTFYLELSASGRSIALVNSEPRSHAIKRASQEWWLAHSSDAWESIIPQDNIIKFVHSKNLKYSHLLHHIFSRWHQDFVASLHGLRNSGDWMASLGTTSDEEERIVEQIVHHIFQYLDRKKTGSVKRTPVENSTSNGISGPGTVARHMSYQTSKIIGKRRDRNDTASGDDELGDDDPNKNDGTKRTKKSADQYNRYVICTQFAAGQDPACPNCFFGAWPSVDRLKQDHLVKVHKIDTSLMKVGKGGTEFEKWWRLFHKLHPGFREKKSRGIHAWAILGGPCGP